MTDYSSLQSDSLQSDSLQSDSLQSDSLQSSPEEQLYNYLLSYSKVESPIQLLQRFRRLFLGGETSDDTGDHEIQTALAKIVSSSAATQEFKFILNRCCYILINGWWSQSRYHWAIPELVGLLGNPHSSNTESVPQQQIEHLLHLFTQTEQYQALHKLAQVIPASQKVDEGESTKPLVTIVRRYPYLYEHYLLNEGSTDEQRETVRQMQIQAQQKFEEDLSKYYFHHFKPGLLGFNPGYRQGQIPKEPVIKNPTLLSDRELNAALRQFTGNVEGSRTYKELAQSFLANSQRVPNYRAFKDDLYDYLTASNSTEGDRRAFNYQLRTYIRSILPQNDSQKLNESLLLRTCSKLLNFLVVESPQTPQHFVFVDLTANIGPTATIGLLLKIVLICQKVKFHLEKRFAILFNHYKDLAQESVEWLVNSLENLSVAFATHFSGLSFS